MKKIIHAISFLHKGERVVVKANGFGKFKVPVTTVRNGNMNTSMKSLSAREVIEHEIIKHCDPTLYLDKGERLRVFTGGDSSYLPAQVEGIIEKHDSLRKEKKKTKLLNNSDSSVGLEREVYRQAGLDMYGWYPDDDGNAD